MSNERSPMSTGGSTWGRPGGLINNATSTTFMEIRYRSLGKALDELRTKRVRLEEELRNGHVEQNEYASTLLKLIVETNSVTKEREDVGEKVKAVRSNKLR
ncbi:hypothetical protein E4H12_03825 [Candidatus Thorarchaeota archaeon]|nr:MAG: hypothetical protein E4H12_03825 [Candidatus Thorarchaeota archaeon]